MWVLPTKSAVILITKRLLTWLGAGAEEHRRLKWAVAQVEK